MPNKNHADCRKCVCLLCMGKTKEMRLLTATHQNVIKEFFITTYTCEDDYLPSDICGNCRTVVQDMQRETLIAC